MEDKEVIRRVKGGDIEAFSVLIEKYHRRLLNFIFRLIDDKEKVEDIGQEVFLNVYKSIRDFDESRGTPFAAWLFISARNRCISEMRTKSFMERPICMDDCPELTSNMPSAEDELLRNERIQALRSSLQQLPEPYQATILQSLKGQSLEEIALMDKVSLGTVKSRLFRARAKLKKLITEYFGGRDYEGI